MTMKAMMKRHVNRFIICVPALRDAVTNRPTTFKVLNTCRSADEACEALENYEKEGGDYANKASAIIDAFIAKHIIRVSATTTQNKSYEFYEIDEQDVIDEGLITKARD